MPFPRYVSFGSGGTKGLAYEGVFDALEDNLQHYYNASFAEWRTSLRGVAGCSSGSIACLMLALGLDRNTRHKVLMQDLSDMRAVMQCPNVSLFFDHFGMEDGSTFKQVIQNVLMCGGMSARSSLGDLKRLLRIDVIMVASNLNTGKPEYLSADTHPDMLVCDAVFASCCIPFLFTPHHHGDIYLVDGYMTDSLPRCFDESDTLFVRVPSDSAKKPQSWPEIIQRFFVCGNFSQQLAQENLKSRVKHFLDISLPNNVTCMETKLTSDAIGILIQHGYASALDHITDRRMFQTLCALSVLYMQHIVQTRSFTACASSTVAESESESEGDPDS